MNQKRTGSSRLVRKNLWRLAIDTIRQFRFGLCALDSRVRRGIYYHVGSGSARDRAHRDKIRQVEACAIQRLDLSQRSKCPGQLPPNLALRSEQ